MKRERINVLAEIAIFVGLAVVLDLIGGMFSPFRQGGSISVAMLPIFIISFRHGWKSGVLGGFILGLIQLLIAGSEIFGWIYEPTPLKIVLVIGLDYVIAFSILGLSGIFKNPFTNKKSFILGIALGSFLRYICHGISGVVVWGNFAADWGIENVWFYSFIFYNLPYMLSSFVLCLVIGLVLYNRNIWDYGLNTIK